MATIKAVVPDKESKRNYYAILKNFTAFEQPVLIKEKGHLLEEIPKNRETNYWRDGVRQIDEDIYLKILRLANIDREDSFFIERDAASNDKATGNCDLFGRR